MNELGIDIETYSSNSLLDGGVYKYVEAEDFTILLFAYCVDRGEVKVVDFANGEELPEDIMLALTDKTVLKTAFNANFERTCLAKYFGMAMPPEEWDCTMVRCARLGFPFSLDQAGQVLGLTNTKMKEGKDLIRYFSLPCKATKTNGGRTRNLPEHAPEKWEMFKQYCIRDVEVERDLRNKVTKLPVTEKEKALWNLDQRINDRGVLIDRTIAENASRMDEAYKTELKEEAKELTGLENPNSVSQLKRWLFEQTHFTFPSLNKKEIPALMDMVKYNKDVMQLFKIRAELGKTSNAKYSKMLECMCHDDRARGLFQFYGANRTGRWAGRLLQLQNLPQNHLEDLDRARNIVKEGDLDMLEMMYGNVPGTLSELIRTAFIAKPGCVFHVCDFSAIEARVIAYIAGEEWVLDTFRNGGDIYCSTASQMFGVPVEKHGQNAELRQKGKIAVLGLGYQGGVGALKAMGGDRMGLTDDEMLEIVNKWRNANKHIVRLWRHVEDAAQACVKTRETFTIEKDIEFSWKLGGLAITLPSGRFIYYPRMRMGEENGKPRLMYDGVNQETKAWGSTFTYGGKMTENIVQAFARDCLAETMLRLDAEHFDIVFHVHDECIIEAKEGQTLEQIEEIFSKPIDWAPGLPLKGAGYTTPYYLKD